MSFRSLRTSAIAVVAVALCFVYAGTGAHARPHATPTPVPTPTPVADPAITKIVRQQFVAWQAGTVNKSLYAAEVQAKLGDDKINDVSKRLGMLGPLTDMVYFGPLIVSDMPAGSRGYIYQMICREGNVYMWLILDGQGKIATVYFKDKLTTEEVEVPASAAPAPSPTP